MKRFSIVSTGYDMNEVNRFIDVVIGRLERISNENMVLRRQVEQLQKENTSAIQKDDKLTKALLAVQETAEKMRSLAKEEAEMIVAEAKRNANAIVHEALVNAQKTENDANVLKKNVIVYKSKLKSQIEILNKLIEETDELN